MRRDQVVYQITVGDIVDAYESLAADHQRVVGFATMATEALEELLDRVTTELENDDDIVIAVETAVQRAAADLGLVSLPGEDDEDDDGRDDSN